MLGSNLDSQIAATVPILKAAHARNVPVFFSTVRYDDREMRDAGIWAAKQKGLRTLTADTDGWEIDRRLDFRETDTLLVKKYASCFFGTDLGSRLVAQRVDTLIITGCTTSGCVRATAVDAVQYGFARWSYARRSGIARHPLMRRAFSISTRNTPMSSDSRIRCSTSRHSPTIRPCDRPGGGMRYRDPFTKGVPLLPARICRIDRGVAGLLYA